MKYPHLIDAAVASSAPLLALINFTDYLAVVRTSLGPQCSHNVARGTEQITKLLDDSHDGWEALTKSFMLCEPLDGTQEKDVANFVQSLVSNFEGVVQYNKDNRDFEVRNMLRNRNRFPPFPAMMGERDTHSELNFLPLSSSVSI